ncbi:MAG: hypothetical protein E4H14_19995 [Candidatus Thorarchaeota archaeon]|nr:MAG: hypothetical protein E4H14_19995 [Candidatus Thorarchaeota archaeon]
MSELLFAAILAVITICVAAILRYFDDFFPILDCRECSRENSDAKETRCVYFILRPILEGKDLDMDIPEIADEVKAKYNRCLFGIHRALYASDSFSSLRRVFRLCLIVSEVALAITLGAVVADSKLSNLPDYFGMISGGITLTHWYLGVIVYIWMGSARRDYVTYSRYIDFDVLHRGAISAVNGVNKV